MISHIHQEKTCIFQAIHKILCELDPIYLCSYVYINHFLYPICLHNEALISWISVHNVNVCALLCVSALLIRYMSRHFKHVNQECDIKTLDVINYEFHVLYSFVPRR